VGLLQDRLFVSGLRRLAGGARRGRPGATAFGLALALAGFVRSRRRPDRELIYARDLKDGETLQIRFAKGPEGGVEAAEADVTPGRRRGGGQRMR
jgi:hypothetical protein